MARDKQRFSDLQRQLKQGNYSQTSGSAFEYLQYLRGINKIVVARRPGIKYLERFNVGVIPFDITMAAAAGDQHCECTMTVMAENIRAHFNANAPLTLFGIQSDLALCSQLQGFYPALARVTLRPLSQTTKDAVVSGITRRAYKRWKSRTGSIPFGRTTGGLKTAAGAASTDLNLSVQEQVEDSITESLKGKNTSTWQVIGISFVPEEHPEAGDFGKEKPSGSGVVTDIPAS